MKQTITLVTLIAWLSLTAFAGVGQIDETESHDYKTEQVTNTTYRSSISGHANQDLSPNFWDNDWDTITNGQGQHLSSKEQLGLSSTEVAYLKSLSNLNAGVTYYVDLANQTYSTSPFQGPSSTSSSSKTTIENRIAIGDQDGTEFITLHTDYLTTTTITTDNVVYQAVGHLHDNSPLLLDLDDNRQPAVAEGERRWTSSESPRRHCRFRTSAVWYGWRV